MKLETVTCVRIYLTEADKTLQDLLRCLHDQAKVRGVTVFRAVTGFGRSGVVHSSSLIDLSLNLPVAVEFFDSPERVEDILKHLQDRLKPGHVVVWKAEVNC
jgi:PII-like signaling protein